jgi:hypothetical protein
MNFLNINNKISSNNLEDKVRSFDNLNTEIQMKQLFNENKKIKQSINKFIKQSNIKQVEPLSLDGAPEDNILFSIEAEYDEDEEREKEREREEKKKLIRSSQKLLLEIEENDRNKVKHKTISNFNTSVVKHRLNETLTVWKNEALRNMEDLQIPNLQAYMNDFVRTKRHSYTKLIDLSHNKILDGEQKFKKTSVKLSEEEMKEFKSSVLQLPIGKIEPVKEEKGIAYLDMQPQERKLASFENVYDSLSDDELENMPGKVIIHPDSYFQRYLDLVILISLLVTLFFTPICAAYGLDGLTIKVIDALIDLIYTADLILGFFKAYYDIEETLIFNPRKIVTNYLLTYFVIDVIAAFPLNTLISFKIIDASDEMLWEMLRFVRLTKGLKLGEIQSYKSLKLFIPRAVRKFCKKMLTGISNFTKNFYRYFVVFIIICHILTCVWIYIGRLDPMSNWFQLIKDDSTDIDVYIASFYFNMLTLFTIGYGDIHSVSMYEKGYNVILLIAGLIIYSFVVSFLSKFAIISDPNKVKLIQNIEYLDDLAIEYMVYHKLVSKIKRFLIYNYKVNNKGKNNFLFELPSNLRNELICNMYKKIVDNFVFFKKTSNQDFNARVLLALRPIKAFKGEKLIKQEDFIDEIILVRKGRLQISCEYKDFIIKLIDICKNEHFGEVLMLLNERSPVTVRVRSSYCELFLLRKFDLMAIFVDFEEIFKVIFNNSSFNMMQLKKIIKVKKNLIDQGLHLCNSYDFTRKVSSISEHRSETFKHNNLPMISQVTNSVIIEEDEDDEVNASKASSKMATKRSGLVSNKLRSTHIMKKFQISDDENSHKLKSNNYMNGDEAMNSDHCKSIDKKSRKYSVNDQEASFSNYSSPKLLNSMRLLNTHNNNNNLINVTGNIKTNNISSNINLNGQNVQINNNNHINIIVNHSDENNKTNEAQATKNNYLNINLKLKFENNFHIIKENNNSLTHNNNIIKPELTDKSNKSNKSNSSADSSFLSEGTDEKSETALKESQKNNNVVRGSIPNISVASQPRDSIPSLPNQSAPNNSIPNNSFHGNQNNNLVNINIKSTNHPKFMKNKTLFLNPNHITNNNVINIESNNKPHRDFFRRMKRSSTTALPDFVEETVKHSIKDASKKDIYQIQNKTNKIYNQLEKNIKTVHMQVGIDDIFNEICEELTKVDQGFLNRRLDALYTKLEKIIN